VEALAVQRFYCGYSSYGTVRLLAGIFEKGEEKGARRGAGWFLTQYSGGCLLAGVVILDIQIMKQILE
jgi:hypothetical protein